MSRVTNIVLLGSCGAFADSYDDDELPLTAFAQVQAWLVKHMGGQSFRKIDGSTEVGGHKCLEADVAIAAFNYLDLAAFMKVLHEAPWRRGADVRVAICADEDWGFQQFEIVKRER